jgi:adenine deaminase
MQMTHHKGQIVDIHHRRIFPGEITVEDGKITAVREVESVESPTFLLPGFVDAHVHIESSMLPPCEFGRIAVRHGTLGTVSDPHEIANVLGVAGVEFMIANARRSPIKTMFGAPSCVPATGFESAGAALDSSAVADLLARPEIGYLSEVMNYPGVLNHDAEVMRKVECAKTMGKPIDGHAPGLRGQDAAAYAAAGITTDHECFSLEEALDKIHAGMMIAIREGSAARNYDALKSLLKTHPSRCMLCTDDMHPNALVYGHINRLVARAIADGADVFDVLRCASSLPVEHYRMPVGLLRVGDPADFIRVASLADFDVSETWIDGQLAAENGQSLIAYSASDTPNQFNAHSVKLEELQIAASPGMRSIRVIDAYDGQLITGSVVESLPAHDGFLHPSIEKDLLKIVVVNRYHPAPVAVAFVRGFGLKQGAIASTVAHDSHNVIAVGADDASLMHAINAVIGSRGGLCAYAGEEAHAHLPLEIAGLMSSQDGDSIAKHYESVAVLARQMGSPLRDPFMTLSFMALLVIPDLKLSDLGLFSGGTFEFVPLVIE